MTPPFRVLDEVNRVQGAGAGCSEQEVATTLTLLL